MRSPADEAVAARDPALPGLAAILDDARLAELLDRALPDMRVDGARVSYLRYKPGTNCIAAFEARAGSECMRGYVKAFAADWPEKRAKAAQRDALATGGGHARFVDDVLRLQVMLFPRDDKLTRLAALLDPAERGRELAWLAAAAGDPAGATIVPLRYKPERRFVGRLVTRERELVVRCHPARHAATSHEGLAVEGCVLRLPRSLGGSPDRRVRAWEWLPGRPLVAVLALDAPVAAARACELAAAGLAELHQLPVNRLPRRSAADELAALAHASEAVATVQPALARRAARLAGQIAGELLALERRVQLIHGDCNAEQLLLDDEGVGGTIGVIDLDELAAGDPAADLGSFVAQLQHAAVVGTLAPAVAAAAAAAVVEAALRLDRGLAAASVDAYAAAGLLLRAPHPFRDRVADWPVRTEQLLARAEALLDGAPRVVPVAPVPAPPVALQRAELTAALDPARVSTLMSDAWRALALGGSRRPVSVAGRDACVRSLRVMREKPGRRCLIAYEVDALDVGGAVESLTVVGKLRVRGLDRATLAVNEALWDLGFRPDGVAPFAVPEPLGALPELRMWLQRLAPGVPTTTLLAGPGGPALGARIAEAAWALHQSCLPLDRQHSVADELRILHERLARVAERCPAWGARIAQVLAGCEAVAATLQDRTALAAPIHRDFYPDQLLVDRSRLTLLDLDLACLGDPALDIGNLVAHLTEQALRTTGDPEALAAVVDAVVGRYLSLAGESHGPAIEAWMLLALARHVSISTVVAGREALTEPILCLCEDRLARFC